MKKIIKLTIFTLIISIFSITKASALTSSLVSSKNTVNYNTEVNISVVVSGTSAGLGSADYTINYDATKLSYLSTSIGQGKSNSDLSINPTSGEVIISYVDNSGGQNAMSNGTVITLTFKALVSSGSTTLSLQGSGYGDKDANILQGTSSGTTISFYKPSSEAYLTSLTVDGESLSPAFNQNTLTYTIEDTEKTSINIKATGASKTSITGTGNKTLNYGSNSLKVIVTAEDGVTKKTYTINIKKIDNRSDENKLKTLSIEGYEIEFKNDVYIYEIDLPSDITTINIEAESIDNKAQITGDGKVELKSTTTSHTIYVTAENGEEQSYTIEFKNRNTTEANTSLKSLSLNGINIALTNSLTYLIGVDSNVESFDFIYETISASSKVNIYQDDKIVKGINIVTITVTDQNLSHTYKILIDKESNSTIYQNLSSFKELNQDITIKLSSNDQVILTKEQLEMINNSEHTVTIKIVNENNGLLYSLELQKGLDDSKNLELNLVFNQEEYPTLTSNIPAGVIIKYYLPTAEDNANVIVNNQGTEEIIASDIKTDDGYITFTSNGASKYYLKTELKNIEESTSSFNLMTFISGLVSGIILSIISFTIYLNKEKLSKNNKVVPTEPIETLTIEEPVNNIENNQTKSSN